MPPMRRADRFCPVVCGVAHAVGGVQAVVFAEEVIMGKEKDSEIKVVVIDKRGNGMMKEFHTNQRLSHYPEQYQGPADAHEFSVIDEQNECYVLADLLFGVPGIQFVEIDGYIVRVAISRAFQWKEVQEQTITLIRQYVRAEKAKDTGNGKNLPN